MLKREKIDFIVGFVIGSLFFIIIAFFQIKFYYLAFTYKAYLFPSLLGGLIGVIIGYLNYQNKKIKRAEQELKKEKLKTEQYLEVANVIFLVLDKNGDITLINQKGCEILGYSKEEVIGKVWFNNFLPAEVSEEIKEFFKYLPKTKKIPEYYENPVITKSGELRTIGWHNKLLIDENNEMVGVLSAGQDITEKKQAESQLNVYATTDTMTSALNRRAGLNILEKQVEFAGKNSIFFSICYIDINDLKSINDTCGHQAGDEIIISSSRIIKQSIRDSDFFVRMGGDEFLIIFPNCKAAEAETIWGRVLIKINEYNNNINKPYKISLSHGIQEYNPNDNLSMEKLLALADKKMYEEKQEFKKS